MNTQANAGELTSRLAEIERDIAAGSGDVLDLLTEKEMVKKRIEAARIASEKRQSEEYKARINAETTERRARLNAILDTGGDLVPRLLLWCTDFNVMRDEIQQRGMGFEHGEMQDHLVLPLNFADQLAAMINSADVEWDYSAVGLFAESQKAERPKRKVHYMRAPKFYNGPPPGFTGAWDPVRGQPFEEPVDGPAAPFPPIEAPA